MKKLSVILGSGFSCYAGLPLVRDINKYFLRDNSKKLLHFHSNEWKWNDFASKVDQRNGLSYDRVAYGYILNELVKSFKKIDNSFTSYEKFYQFIIDETSNIEFLPNICKKAKKIFEKNEEVEKKNRFYNMYTDAFNKPCSSQIYNMINYLISDLLYLRKSTEKFSANYDNFFIYLSKFDQRNIFTLNHDYLLETLLMRYKISFCDGFTEKDSVLRNDNKKKIRCFVGDFNSSYNLIKLHGSIDVYQYECYKKNGLNYYSTGEFIYFKTHNFYEKQRPVRVNNETGDIVQNCHRNITPQFITGTKKKELIDSIDMYNKLYLELEQKINSTEELLIIGYSYSDEHINKQIELALSQGSLQKIININLKKEFPLKTMESKKIMNYKQITDIINVT